MFDTDWVFGHVTVSCDTKGCDNEETVEGEPRHPPSFSQVAQEIKSEGWVIRKRGGDFYHICPACVEDEEYNK